MARTFTLMKPRMAGDDVRALQHRLVGHGFGPLVRDGVYGPVTARAVGEFQRVRNLPVTGEAGPQTSAALAASADVELGRELFRLVALRAPEPSIGQFPQIRIDSQNDELVDVRTALDALHGHRPSPKNGRIIAACVAGELKLADLDRELMERDDLWAPSELKKWIRDTTGQELKALVAGAKFTELKVSLHVALLATLASLRTRPVRAAGESTSPSQQTRSDLLRGVRLTALLQALVDETLAPHDAAELRRFLRLATIVVDPSSLPAQQLARPPIIADLKIVRFGPPRYEPGAIAHIENVMATEKRERSHRSREQSETTEAYEMERTEESEQDLSTSGQTQLQQEASLALRDATQLEAGVQVSAYGPTMRVDADARAARQDSKDEVSRMATTFSNQVTQRTRQRVVERVREQRSVRRFFEIEETNLHNFTNTGNDAKHVVGVYRWVEQVNDAWIENYGKRLMLEFVVPEPAAVVRWAWQKAGDRSTVGSRPLAPTNPADQSQPLEPAHVTRLNYHTLVARYGAKDVKPPPPDTVTVGINFDRPDGAGGSWEDTSKTLVVPAGYVATTMVFQGRHRTDDPDEDEHPLGPGNGWCDVHVGKSGFRHAAEWKWSTPPVGQPVAMHGETGTLPVSIAAEHTSFFAMNLTVDCQCTAEHLMSWQIEVYEAIMDAHREQLTAWEDEKVRSEAAALTAGDPMQGSANPEWNRIVERRELRRGVIHMLIGAAQDEGAFAGDAVTLADGQRPRLDLDVAAAERDAIQFFEEAFEWQNITWVHYPYYWASTEDHWLADITHSTADPSWSAFLSAGASRVVVPVRPGFESAVALYVATGAIWLGGQVPVVGEQAYLGMTEEIGASVAAGQVPRERVELEPIRVPTPLVWLQPTGDLNPVV